MPAEAITQENDLIRRAQQLAAERGIPLADALFELAGIGPGTGPAGGVTASALPAMTDPGPARGVTASARHDMTDPRAREVTIPSESRLSSVNNNPGNLRYAGQTGAVPGEGGFAKFPSPNEGYDAVTNQVKLDTSRGMSLGEFLTKYAPPTENDTPTYIQNISSEIGGSPDDALTDFDPEVLAEAISKFESGTTVSAAPDLTDPGFDRTDPQLQGGMFGRDRTPPETGQFQLDPRLQGEIRGPLRTGAAPPVNKIPGAAEEDIMAAGGEVEPSVELSDPLTAPVGPDEGDEGLPEQVGGQRGLRLLELLGGIGGDIFKSRAIGKANEATAGRQARSNLIAALRGGGGGKVAAEQPSLGLLGNLVSGAGKLGTGLREAGAAETAGDEATFANRLAQRKAAADEQTSLAALIRASRTGTGKLPTAAQNKVSFMEKGKEIFDAGASISDLEARIRADPDYQALVQQSPNIAAELIGHAKKGWGDREQGIFDRTIDEANADLSKGRESRSQLQFESNEEDRALEGYAGALRGAVKQASRNPGGKVSDLEDPKKFFERFGAGLMSIGGQAQMLGLYEEAAGDYYDEREKVIDRDRKIAREDMKVIIAKEHKGFTRMEALRKSLQSLPGVKAFSGLQGIGGAFERMNRLYGTYKNDPNIGRGAFQNAIVQNFQRMIDPATVRLGDIELIVQSQSAWAQFQTSIARVVAGGFVEDSLLDDMMKVAQNLHSGQRQFVEEEVGGAIRVWNTFHENNMMTPEDARTIAGSILGGSDQIKSTEGGNRMDNIAGGG